MNKVHFRPCAARFLLFVIAEEECLNLIKTDVESNIFGQYTCTFQLNNYTVKEFKKMLI